MSGARDQPQNRFLQGGKLLEICIWRLEAQPLVRDKSNDHARLKDVQLTCIQKLLVGLSGCHVQHIHHPHHVHGI